MSKAPHSLFLLYSHYFVDQSRGAKRSPLCMAITGVGTPGSGQWGCPLHPACTCTPKLQSCEKQPRGVGEPRLRPARCGGSRPGQRVEPRVGRGLALGEGGGGGGVERGGGGRETREGRREQLPREARRKVAPRGPAPRGSRDAPDSQWLRRGVQQMASDCAVPSSSSSSSSSSFSAEVARRWNGWSPYTHHHLSCAREARGSAAPRGCGGGSSKAGECGRAAPRVGDA